MVPWQERPFEMAYLLNPAFLSLIVANAAKGCNEEGNVGLKFAYAFLVPPLVLHEVTRLTLPHDTRTTIHDWLTAYPEVQINLAIHTHRLVPYVQEAIMFSLNSHVIAINEEGRIILVQARIDHDWPEDTEPFDCCRKARLLGRWFAQFDTHPIFEMLGVRP
jgi:hypothetical protein